MNTTLRLAKNSAALLAAFAIDRFLNVLFVAILVRHISQEEFGVYTTVITFFELGTLLADFGMSQALIRDIAQKPNRATPIWSNALVLGGVWSLVGWIVLGSISTLLGYPPEVLNLIWLIGAALVFKVVWLYSEAVLRALERMEITGAASAVYAVLFTTAAILFLVLGWQLPSLIGIIVVLTAVMGLAMFAVVNHWFVRFVPRVDRDLCRQMIQEVWPIAVILACDILLRRSGILFLSLVRPMTDVAIYGTAAKTIDALTLLTISLTGALFPLLASRWEKGAEAGWRTYRYSLRYFTVLGIGLSTGAFMLARPLLLLFLGPSYAESLIPFRILTLVLLMGFVGRPMAAMLLVSKDQLIALISRAVVVIAITVGLSLWLIPRYGYLAASWISVASSAGLLFFTARLTRRLTNERIPWKEFLVRPLVAALGMAAILYLFQGGSLLWTVPLGAASYGLLLALLREFHAPEYTPLRRTWTTLWQDRLAR